MAENTNTGNPVFDYRADYRARASLIQKWILLAGAALLPVALVLWIFKEPCIAWGIAGAAGAACLATGTAWGFYWRRKIRSEFRQKYGA